MIGKLFLLCWLVLLPGILGAQTKIVEKKEVYLSDTVPNFRKVRSTTTYYEVETLAPLCEYVTDSYEVDSFIHKDRQIIDTTLVYDKHHAVRYYLCGVPQVVSTDISYIGGWKKFQHYQDSLYWAYYDGPEMNMTCWYTLLFDKNLKIKEVKIVRRNAYDNRRYDFDGLVKKILLSTDGCWQTTDDTVRTDYYFWFGMFRLR